MTKKDLNLQDYVLAADYYHLPENERPAALEQAKQLRKMFDSGVETGYQAGLKKALELRPKLTPIKPVIDPLSKTNDFWEKYDQNIGHNRAIDEWKTKIEKELEGGHG